MLSSWTKIDPNDKTSLPPKDKEVLICTSDDSIHGRYITVSHYKDVHSYSDDPRHGTTWGDTTICYQIKKKLVLLNRYYWFIIISLLV